MTINTSINEFATKFATEIKGFFDKVNDLNGHSQMIYLPQARNMLEHFEKVVTKIMQGKEVKEKTVFELEISEKNGININGFFIDFNATSEEINLATAQMSKEKAEKFLSLYQLHNALQNTSSIEGKAQYRMIFKPENAGVYKMKVIYEDKDGQLINYYDYKGYIMPATAN